MAGLKLPERHRSMTRVGEWVEAGSRRLLVFFSLAKPSSDRKKTHLIQQSDSAAMSVLDKCH